MVDLSDILIDDLIDELENRNIYIKPQDWEILNECGDIELIDELESRGYSVDSDSDTYDFDIFDLYELKRINSQNFDAAFANFIWIKTGRIL